MNIRLLLKSTFSAALCIFSVYETAFAQSPDMLAEAKLDLKQIDCEIATFSEDAAKLEKVRLTGLADLLHEMKQAGVAEAALSETTTNSFPILSALYNGDQRGAEEQLFTLVEKHGADYAQGKLDEQVVVLGGRISAYTRRYSKDVGRALFQATKGAKTFLKLTNGIGLAMVANDLTESANAVWMSQMKSEEMKRVAARAKEELSDVERQLNAVTSLVSTLLNSREGTVSRWRNHGVAIPDDYFTESCLVEDEGFNGVWKVKPEIGVGQDIVLQIEDNRFWIKSGNGMESCGVLGGEFDLMTGDQVIGSYATTCGDLHIKAKVAMQKHEEDYGLTMCLSAATGKPDDCTIGNYYWDAERVGDLALK